MTKLKAALLYASWGWPVLPVVPNGKIPATHHGIKDATTDENKIREWWNLNPEFNIGIACGEQSGLNVFDIDPRNGGDDGWEEWLEQNGKPPDGAMQLTAGGGQHYLAQYNEQFRSCKLAKGVDLLSDGRYFLVSPSEVEGRKYEWEASSDPADGVAPFSIPERWVETYQGRINGRHATAKETLIKGNRNDGLMALAGAMRHHGMSEREILAAISVANDTRCEIPLPQSEVSAIARSVVRYPPKSNTAESVALGSEAAQKILAAAKAAEGEYHFTRATSYLNAPAPLKWLIKKWLPESAMGMIFGPSGAGKSFVALDMACHIALGVDWCGHKTKQGLVVYMAGEGNFGFRQRIAAWCQHYGVEQLDNLLISNKAIDLDSGKSASQVIDAVREVTDQPVCWVIIDTLNNHMSGDENSAQDTRKMIACCQVVGKALDAATTLVHHQGHAESSRARGSSAWRASLDCAVRVNNKKGQIQVFCDKMKDAQEPEALGGHLKEVVLKWVDEDGEHVKGALFEHLKNADLTQDKKTKKTDEKEVQAERELFCAWLYGGTAEHEGMPLITRQNLIDHYQDARGMAISSAQAMLKSARNPGLEKLISSGRVTRDKVGFVVRDGGLASVMRLREKSYK